jgi:hypothetical protein
MVTLIQLLTLDDDKEIPHVHLDLWRQYLPSWMSTWTLLFSDLVLMYLPDTTLMYSYCTTVCNSFPDLRAA